LITSLILMIALIIVYGACSYAATE
jgi:hypothetical protein